jgi:BMFP domain-containing protein YqiC
VHYLQAKGGAEFMPDNATAPAADVEAWLRRSRLEHRLTDAVAISCEAFEIAKQIHAQAPEAQAAWQANVQEGTTANDAALSLMDEIALTQKIAAMSVSEFGAQREPLGVYQSLAAFLGGQH